VSRSVTTTLAITATTITRSRVGSRRRAIGFARRQLATRGHCGCAAVSGRSAGAKACRVANGIGHNEEE
jgi:hypothetical protein